MSEPTKDKVADEKQPDIKKTKEYRNFRKLLKQVIKAPPMRKITSPQATREMPDERQ